MKKTRHPEVMGGLWAASVHVCIACKYREPVLVFRLFDPA